MKKYKCEVCGRESSKKIRLGGYTLCSKHMHQLHNHGKFLDNIQRTNNDLNDYNIVGKITIFNLYNQKNERISSFVIDTEDIEKVKYHKWRLNHGHVVTGLPAKNSQRDLSWVVLDLQSCDISKNRVVVDHINGNGLDNRKNNLRICKQSANVLNKSYMSNNTTGFIGVSYKKDRDVYDPEIRMNGTRCHLGHSKIFEEAVYKRYYAEVLIYKEFANKEEQDRKLNFVKNISQNRKKELEQIVEEKLRNKKLWQ